MHHHQSPEMKTCIDNCLACYRECLSTAVNHCLEMGGKHTEPQHFKLIGSEQHKHVRGGCAEICSQCANDCERIGDMQSCVEVCRKCADSYRKMAA